MASDRSRKHSSLSLSLQLHLTLSSSSSSSVQTKLKKYQIDIFSWLLRMKYKRIKSFLPFMEEGRIGSYYLGMISS
jgi:hypothetical protein